MIKTAGALTGSARTVALVTVAKMTAPVQPSPE